MQTFNHIAEQLVAAMGGIDAEDLPALAAIHSRLQEAAQQVGSLPPAARDAARVVAASAEALVSGLILREVDDAARGMAALAEQVNALLAIAGGDAAALAAAAARPDAAPAQAEPPAPAQSPAPAAPGTIPAEDLPLVMEFIAEARGHIDAAEAAILTVEEHPDDVDAVSAIFRSFHTIKGVAGFLNLADIGSLAHCAESLLDLARKGQVRLAGGRADAILAAIDLMKAMVGALEAVAPGGSSPAAPPGLGAVLERLRACQSGSPESPAPAVPSAAPAEAPAAAHKADVDATVKVATGRLDSLIDMVGELVIAESMVRQDLTAATAGDLRVARNLSHLGKITRTLQELAMSMRMVPIQGVFQKMARLVRDLGRKACKEVEFIVAGGETEVDRTVVESIADPLVHMVRNAVDHGLEPPEQREAAGKPRMGRVALSARHQAGNIVIEISDDGRGLDRGRIVRKAVSAGLVRDDQELSDAEAFALIFAPGLSTAEKVTDISGRGVGMDVVKRNIEALRGRIDIASEPGRGSTFTIRLPLTLAVIDGLVVRVGGERYILPLTSIERSLRPAPGQVRSVQGRAEMIDVRGMLLPVYRLHRIFGVAPRTTEPAEALIVIVQDSRRRCGLMVDDVLGQQQVVIKSLGDGIGKTRGISGGAILGDGNVSLILDVPGLVEAATEA